MHRLIYMSSAAHDMTDAELVQLLEQARARNAELNLTGMLLYKDGFFLQVLEGDKQHVDAVYRSICLDERNTAPYLIEEDEVEDRNFPAWTMGFHNLSTDPSSVDEGFFDVFEHREKIQDLARHKDFAVGLLNSFVAP